MKFRAFMLNEAPSPSGSPPPGGSPMGAMGGMGGPGGPPGGMPGMGPMGGGPMPMGGGPPPMGGLGGPGAPPMGGMPGMGQPQTNLEIKSSNVWDALDKFLDNSGGHEDKKDVKSSQPSSLPSLPSTGTPAPSGKKHLL